MCGVYGANYTSPGGFNKAERVRPRWGYMGGRAISRGIGTRHCRVIPRNVTMEVFLSKRIIVREAIGDDDLYTCSVVYYALLRLRVRWVSDQLLSLQLCFDPLYDFIGRYHVALSYEYTTIPLVVLELLLVRVE